MESVHGVKVQQAPPGHGWTPPSARPSSMVSSPSPRVAVTRKKELAVRRHTRMPYARDAIMMYAMVGRGAVRRGSLGSSVWPYERSGAMSGGESGRVCGWIITDFTTKVWDLKMCMLDGTLVNSGSKIS